MARKLRRLDDPEELGPTMLALTEKQRAFVIGKVFEGLNNHDAARAAGYSARTYATLSKRRGPWRTALPYRKRSGDRPAA